MLRWFWNITGLAGISDVRPHLSTLFISEMAHLVSFMIKTNPAAIQPDDNTDILSRPAIALGTGGNVDVRVPVCLVSRFSIPNFLDIRLIVTS